MSEKIPCVWRRVDDGWSLCDPLGWIAYAGEAKKGGFYWKLHSKETHYVETLALAKSEAEKAVLAGVDEEQHEMVNVLHCRMRELANFLGGKTTSTLLFNDNSR